MPRIVLVVDDSPTIRGFAKLHLKSLPIEIAEAEEGAKALEIARRSPPVVAIVDINMPGMDGLTFVRELRKDARSEVANVPVLLLTADKSEDTRRKGLDAGATGFVGKPIKGPELHAAVKRFLEASP